MKTFEFVLAAVGQRQPGFHGLAESQENSVFPGRCQSPASVCGSERSHTFSAVKTAPDNRTVRLQQRDMESMTWLQRRLQPNVNGARWLIRIIDDANDLQREQ
ncbi:MAG: hypothetical protein ACK5AN_02855 [Planctomyces sp.]